jgi:hypothetical protein
VLNRESLSEPLSVPVFLKLNIHRLLDWTIDVTKSFNLLLARLELYVFPQGSVAKSGQPSSAISRCFISFTESTTEFMRPSATEKTPMLCLFVSVLKVPASASPVC